MKPHNLLRKSPGVAVVLVLVWLGATIKGMTVLWNYQNVPGKAGAPPERWPTSSRLPAPDGRALLVMAIHPHCPCRRASLGELALLTTRLRGRLSACVLFIEPNGMGENWIKTDLWKSASTIPGALVFRDEGNAEARHFGALTSGQTVVYDAQGRLLFSGGITPSRGHWGASDGFQAIVSRISQGTLDRFSTPVYGCSLETRSRRI